MKFKLLTFLLFLSFQLVFSQSETNFNTKELIKQADSLYQKKEYKQSGTLLNKAILILRNGQNWEELIEVEHKQVKNKIGLKNYDSAIGKLDSIAAFSIQKLGANNKQEALLYTQKAYVLAFKQKKYKEGLEALTKAEAIQKQDSLNNIEALGETYYYIAWIYNYSKKKKKAAVYFNKCYQLLDNNDFKQHKYLMNSLNELSLIKESRYKFKEAVAFKTIYLEHLIEQLGENNIKVADTYSSKGYLLQRLEQFDKSEAAILKSIKICENLGKGKSAEAAKSYLRLGLLYDRMALFPKSLEAHTKSLHIRLELFEDNNIDVAWSYNNVGYANQRLSRYKEAIKYFTKAEEVFRAKLGPNHYNVGFVLSNIAGIYYLNSELETAKEYYFKCLSVFKNYFGKENLEVAAVYNNMARVYSSNREHEQALKYYLRSFEIKHANHRKVRGYDVTTGNLAQQYRRLGQYDKSLEYFKLSTDYQKEVFGEHSLKLGTSYRELSLLYYDQKDYLQSLNYLQKALSIQRKFLTKKSKQLSNTYYSISKSFNKLNKVDSSLYYIQRAILAAHYSFSDTTNLKSLPSATNFVNWYTLLNTLKAKAYILPKYFSNEDTDELVLKHYQVCDTIVSLMRTKMKKNKDKYKLQSSAHIVYSKLIPLCLQLYDKSTDSKTKSNYLNLAYNYMEKTKSTVLLDNLYSTEAFRFSNIPDSLLVEVESLQNALAKLKKDIAICKDEDEKQKLYYKKFESQDKYNKIIKLLEANYPNYHDLKYKDNTVDIQDIAKKLNSKTCLLNYYIGDSTLHIFSIQKKKIEKYHKALPDNFQTTLKLYRNAIATNNDNLMKIYSQKAYQIYKLLIPEALPERIENLIIIPDNNLANIPFESLLSSKPSQVKHWKDLPYLINKYNISYFYSSNLFYKNKTQAKAKSKHNKCLAVAPAFLNNNTSTTAASTRSILKLYSYDEESAATNTRSFSLNLKNINPLPESFEEVNEIKNLFSANKGEVTSLTMENASEHSFKSANLSEYNYIHLATHGIINANNPVLSGLIFAQDSTSEEDNILFTDELYNLRLNADLTVLSACESALGKSSKGEGIIGLTRALIYAGSKNNIVSLWKVSDKSTKELMVKFYTKLFANKRMSYSDVLSNTKRELIKEATFASPFHWASFVLNGN